MTDDTNSPMPTAGTASFEEAGHLPALAVGATSEVSCRVAVADSPRNLRQDDSDEFPDVLSTAKMVGLMELAAARLMRPLLGSDELSVGVRVEIDHLAPTPLFANVRARAVYLGPEGKLHAFKVELHDDGGLAGKGRHTRAVVTPARLLEKARRRLGPANIRPADSRS